MSSRSFLGVICDLNQLLSDALNDLLKEVRTLHDCSRTPANHVSGSALFKSFDPTCAQSGFDLSLRPCRSQIGIPDPASYIENLLGDRLRPSRQKPCLWNPSHPACLLRLACLASTC